MYGWRSQIGFIVPVNNTVFEPEMYYLVPEGVSFHFTKIVVSGPTDGKDRGAAEGADILHRSGVDVIVYAGMAASFVGASQWEQETTERTGLPAVTAANATKEALQAVGAQSIALVCHYTEDRLRQLRGSFEVDGFKVVSVGTASITEGAADLAKLQEISRIPAEEIYRIARKADSPEVDAICILPTNLRTFPILQQLEYDLGKPVVSTNQAILWKALQLAGIKPEIEGYGRLLSGDALLPLGVHED